MLSAENWFFLQIKLGRILDIFDIILRVHVGYEIIIAYAHS